METLKKMVNAALDGTDAVVNILELAAKLVQGVHDGLHGIIEDLKMK